MQEGSGKSFGATGHIWEQDALVITLEIPELIHKVKA